MCLVLLKVKEEKERRVTIGSGNMVVSGELSETCFGREVETSHWSSSHCKYQVQVFMAV